MHADYSQNRYKSVPVKMSRISDVVWFHELNPRGRSEYGDSGHLISDGRLFLPHDKILQRDIVDKFVVFGGWDQDQTIIVQKLLPDQVTEALRRLEIEYERVKTEAVESGEVLQLQVFKHLYCDSKGQLYIPKWMGVTCNRRGSQILTIWTALAKILKGNLEELQVDLPMKAPDNKDQRFEHDDLRIVAATRENTAKTAGFKPMIPFDIIRMVYQMVVNSNRSNGWVEKHLSLVGTRRVIYTGWARFIQFCEVEMDWGFRLWDRLNPYNQYKRDATGNVVMNGEEKVLNPDFIDTAGFNQAAWQGPTAPDHPFCHYAMGAMTDLSKDLAEFNKKREKDGKPIVSRPIGKEGRKLIADWIDHFNLSGGKGTTKKIMDRTGIDRLKDSSTVKVGRIFAKAVSDNDVAVLNTAVEREYGYNHTFDASPAVYLAFETALKMARRAELSEDELVTLWNKVTQLPAQIVAERLSEAKVS